ncbi:GNAT family N-acetyltransferase [Kutzneria viridogrisea]|uniref:N-acetyltransferase domain-containing protein n=2 Tax=Kutzneria TaxID=43356 RepID=W5WK13_9PSEU|nr:GNAT family N-acetyltransferase [Kutzneria albida]AHI00917.1 hypothetical protein KALB_7559 [Kutzneria albida DSM 43870]MBA8926194.1 RimJ/RimL family protein N-acetyltransferase [Kutzneria viridogrisea]
MTELRTERLQLRRMVAEDLPTLLEIECEPAGYRYELTGPPGHEHVRSLLDRMVVHWAEHGFGYCVVELAETGAAIGLGGVRLFEVDGEAVLNLAYRFLERHWGKGYASEMASAVVDWAERELPQYPVVVSMSPINTPSRRLAEKLGFREYTTQDIGYGPEPVLRRSEPLVRGRS